MKKIISVDKLLIKRKKALRNKKIILVTGVFDILHLEHIHLLRNAKKEGDLLVVAIESDNRVQKLKGNDRPFNPQANRAEVLEALESVNLVCILPESFSNPNVRKNFIIDLKPDIYAVSENTPFLEEKRLVMKLVGGKLKIVHKYNPDISSTKLINAKLVKNR